MIIRFCVKVNLPNSVIYLHWTPIFEWHVIRCGSKIIHLKRHVFNRDWTTCSNIVNHSRVNSQHNWGPYMVVL